MVRSGRPEGSHRLDPLSLEWSRFASAARNMDCKDAPEIVVKLLPTDFA